MILDAAIEMHGQIVYVNGERVAAGRFRRSADVPFGFIAIPQYATERILREANSPCAASRSSAACGSPGSSRTPTACDATLAGDDGEQHRARADYLIGADGAHSAVRKALA